MDNKLLEIFFPWYDWALYEIAHHEIIDNEDEETNRFYKKSLVVTIEEKNIFPEELWDSSNRYAHWFWTTIEYNDFPTRDMTTHIKLKTRRRKNKITKETSSKKLNSVIMSWTRSPTDLVSFLKYGDWTRSNFV